MESNVKIFLVSAAAFVIALAVGFSVGMRYRGVLGLRNGWPNQPIMGRRFGPMMNYRMGHMDFGMHRGGLAGQIVAISGNQATIKLFDGREEKVTLSNSTTYTKTLSVTQADLQTGQNVIVSGQVAADGSISAQAIRIGAQ